MEHSLLNINIQSLLIEDSRVHLFALYLDYKVLLIYLFAFVFYKFVLFI